MSPCGTDGLTMIEDRAIQALSWTAEFRKNRASVFLKRGSYTKKKKRMGKENQQMQQYEIYLP